MNLWTLLLTSILIVSFVPVLALKLLMCQMRTCQGGSTRSSCHPTSSGSYFLICLMNQDLIEIPRLNLSHKTLVCLTHSFSANMILMLATCAASFPRSQSQAVADAFQKLKAQGLITGAGMRTFFL